MARRILAKPHMHLRQPMLVPPGPLKPPSHPTRLCPCQQQRAVAGSIEGVQPCFLLLPKVLAGQLHI